MRLFYSSLAVLIGTLFCLNANAQKIDDATLRWLIKKNAGQLHISASDAENAAISNSYFDAGTNITYVYLQQRYKNLKVFNNILTIIFRDNEVLYSSGRFVGGIEEKAGLLNPSLQASQAVENTAQHLKLRAPQGLQIVADKMPAENKIIFSPSGIGKKEIETELMWVTSDDGATVKLAWNVNIDVLGSSDWWNVRVNARTGEVMEKDNWTVNETLNDKKANPISHTPIQTGSASVDHQKYSPAPPTVTNGAYYVVPFPYESPSHHALALENEPWLKAGAGNNAITNGWHYDGTTNYNITRGNNAFAYLDVANSNAPNATTNWPDTSTTANPSLSFNFVPTFSQQPGVNINKKAAVANLFYWNNMMHDVMYQYGFNEVSGNFQADNLGRGGNGNDYVQAEGQDASGTNNANFSTPTDGSRPRMQMYLFSGVSGVIVNSPSTIAGNYAATEGNFSTNNHLANTGPVTGQVVYYNDNVAGSTHIACTGAPANSVTGKIALIDRGTCNFTAKVLNAQNAGAIAVIMVNNVAGGTITMGGTDNTITIPAVMISQADGSILAAQLANGVNATLTPPIGRDGDLDNSVVCHEYTHGISNRLTGGPANASCLSNAEQGGEGWSDYVALMMITNWSTAQLTDGGLNRGIGTYVIGQAPTGLGIRTYPYTTNMTVDPHTYADLAGNTEVHYIGEVWCSALWDMTWNIIQQVGSIETNLYNANGTGGNVIALKLVTEGLRLQPCLPGFLDARNAILAADSILYGNAHRCAIWNAFARRGMGFSAIQGSSSSAVDQVAAYDVPSSISLQKSSVPVSIPTGSQQTVTVKATCQCQVPASSYTLRDTIPTGFTYVSNAGGGTASGNIVTFPGISFTATDQTKTFTVTVQATGTGCAVDTAVNDNRDGLTVGGLTSSIGAGTTQWVSSNVRSKSPSNSWYAANQGTATDFMLTSNAFTANNLSIFSFWHYFVTEDTWDGGHIEVSTNGGTSWIDAGPYIVQNGYNRTMDAASPWPNQKAFSGVSYAQGSNQFINTIVNLSTFSGQSLKVRLRMRTDAANPATYEGWFVDDVREMNGCGGIVQAGLYNSSNALIDNAATPIFITQAVNAVTVQTQPTATSACSGANASFSVVAGGLAPFTYQWQVSTDGGTTYTNVSGATNSTLTLTGITATMNGNLYHCVVSNGSNTAVSDGVALTVNTAASFTAQPSNATACAPGGASFTAAASSTPSYQWQVSTDGGTTWNNVTNGSVYTGVTSSTLAISNATGLNGNQYRTVATNPCAITNSGSATLTVNATPSVSAQPADVTQCASGGAASFTIAANGTPAPTLQWQVSTDGGTAWNNVSNGAVYSGVTTTTLSLASTAGLSGNKYRALATNSCATTNSNAATLTLTSAPTANAVSNMSVCSGGTTSFTSTTTGSALTYQWQVSTDGGATWNNVTDGGVYSGSTTASLSITGVAVAMNTYQYHVVVTNSCGNATANPGTLTVNTASASIAPTPANVCANASSVSLSGSPSGGVFSGTGVSGSNFNPANGSIGANTITYTYTSGSGCVATATSTITVDAIPVVTPDAKAVCIGSANSIALTGTPAGGTWSGTNVSGSSFNATGLAAGAYNVTYSATNAANCTNSATTTVTINALPVVTAEGKNVCIGGAAALTGTPAGGTWSGANVSGSSYNAPGTEVNTTVTYTYTNNNGCKDSAHATITVASCASLGDDGGVILYPNPASQSLHNGLLHLKFNTSALKAVTCRMYAADGKLVFVDVMTNITSGTIKDINISGLAAGSYLLILNNNINTEVKTFKVVIRD